MSDQPTEAAVPDMHARRNGSNAVQYTIITESYSPPSRRVSVFAIDNTGVSTNIPSPQWSMMISLLRQTANIIESSRTACRLVDESAAEAEHEPERRDGQE